VQPARRQRLSQRSHIPRTSGEAVQQETGIVALAQLEGFRLPGVHAEAERFHIRTLVTMPSERYAHCTMPDTPKPPAPSLQIQLDEDVAQGRYANMAMVDHTETEFTLDFIYVYPQQPRAKVLSRVITSPQHLKRLMLALQENLARYEAKHGTIHLREEDRRH
jgi:hypothetical protein